jgi:hypothetical protein
LQKHDIPIRFRGGFDSGFRGGFGGGNGNNDLVQWVAKNCSVVPASAYHVATASSMGGFGPGGGGQQLYDCGG